MIVLVHKILSVDDEDGLELKHMMHYMRESLASSKSNY